MTPLRRWSVTAVVAVLVVAAPVALRSLPAGDCELSAEELLALVRDAGDASYSGYVETVGTLALPAADRFSEVGALFGERTRLRVWWRGDDSWRVDRLVTAGEVDLHHDGRSTTEYDYEDARAERSFDPDIRLARTADLLPPALAARFLSDPSRIAAERLPVERVAGVAAPGLRVRPVGGLSRIDRLDLWVDPSTGVALRAEVYAVGSERPDFTSTFLDFSSARPGEDVVRYVPTPETELEVDSVLDIADAANQYAPLRPPGVVAGLERTAGGTGAVGVYGAGFDQLIAIPLRDREADPLREQVRATFGHEPLPSGDAVAVGPLGVLLTGAEGEGGWLVAGWVSQETLEAAARDLVTGTVPAALG